MFWSLHRGFSHISNFQSQNDFTVAVALQVHYVLYLLQKKLTKMIPVGIEPMTPEADIAHNEHFRQYLKNLAHK